MLSTLTLLLATIASLTAAACTSSSASGACYTSTTTVLNPTCVPWTGICPLMLCATPTATATAIVPLVTPYTHPDWTVVRRGGIKQKSQFSSLLSPNVLFFRSSVIGLRHYHKKP
ncbi:uncharacterized protein MYCGRDRAFT_95574 [Zymoseptoria tritici IPO323]|uniref:Secreted protein n=1 Tax=Zymoseptoria tritici (strain CBS 115943 / IPO323) TaxID=336722 RepID=F9XJ46_ZYMTI|nr:uncharacterized protein MYCGRDRAFT_95574 [Zymoseptoria tritici IPO323]EGP84780.1 hypothetical protein MYCGRDRAFT_95574 [Zymoseptoria tritici IPO323]